MKVILKNGSFAKMAKDIINRKSKIVIFGTGVIGLTVTPQIIEQYGLGHYIKCYIDNDRSKWGTSVCVCGRQVPVYAPEVINTYDDNITVLIAISRYYNAYEQMRAMEKMKKSACYIIPAMCIDNFHNQGGKGVIKTSDIPIIPKKIHYMWLGGKTIPDQLQKCMESWKRFCPDYEIIKWDETNYDVHKNLFVSQAYDNGKYGFVPDYARIEILYEHGGIYMDTDVELKKNIDELLYQTAFCGVEKWQVLNWGGCSGSVKGHKALEPYLERWKERSLIRNDGSIDPISSGYIDTSVALEKGYVVNGKNQTVDGLNIYTYDYFHPYDYMSGKLEETTDTFSIHQFHGGWLDEKAKSDNQKAVSLYDSLMESAESI